MFELISKYKPAGDQPEAIKELVTITPEYALLKNGKKITIDEIKKDDILICKPGMKIAVDGVITNGTTHVDESFITGESIPSKKIKDMKVVAGSLNIDGSIEYRALKIGKDSTISEIVRLVVEATNTKAPISKIADKVSGIFVPTVIIISIITLIIYLILGYSISDSLIRFVTVLVVACPCALGLATPLATIVSEGVCAKNGILVKTSEVLELASKIDTVIFDKTGTLTFGKLKVSKINNYSTYTEKELLKIISSLESKSSHPIATAFKSDGLYKVTRKSQYINGQLVSGTVTSSTEIKPAINRIIVKGQKYAPNVADLSYWAWPTDKPYTITTYFEYRWGSFHDALDIYVGYGSSIYAANNGVVVKAVGGCSPGYTRCNGGRGNYIIVNHNAGGYYTIYMHLREINVSVGQTVARGQKIATMGNTGYVVPTPSSYNPYGGTHLHFGVMVGSSNGTPVNPLNFY